MKAGAWNGDVATLDAYTGVTRTEAFAKLQLVLGKSAEETTRLLWSTYEPWQIWYVFAAVGAVSLIGMLIFSQRSKKWKDLDV